MGARHGEDAVPSIEHASSTIIKIGRILSDLIVEDDDSEISVKLLIPISFCVLAGMTFFSASI